MADTPHPHPTPRVVPPPGMKRYRPDTEVDFVIVGSGSAGGVMARELSRAGFSVVVLEQGAWLTEVDFKHDEVWTGMNSGLTNNPTIQPQTIRATDKDTAIKNGWATYGRVVGGGSVHFTANYWRFPEIEFQQASRLGVPDGSSVADWPISYADLEPYYTKVEWEVGVSGLAGNPFEPRRSKPFPMPPLPIKSEGVLFEKGAKKMGWTPWPAPMAILSRPYRGRSACMACGFCMTFGCEYGAKSSSLASMVPGAIATGRCEIRPFSYVSKIEMGANGRTTGVTYFDKQKKTITQRAKSVVLCANGVETPKLLLMSATPAFPNGLANGSGMVGRNITFNGGALVGATFEHPINAWKGVVVSRIALDMVEFPKATGLYGGGGFDMRSMITPVFAGLLTPGWGSEWKKQLREFFTHGVFAYGHATQLPVATNRVDLDPTTKDEWGLPVPRLTFKEHANDVGVGKWAGLRSKELLEAAGAKTTNMVFDGPSIGGPHLLGTCRMGNDPRTSVINADHRAHDVPNLFIVDGSTFVTSGRGQPTMTIQALAFRAADRIADLVRTRAL